jgi:pimeloyl-ACP methyl ester carboxylesterase
VINVSESSVRAVCISLVLALVASGCGTSAPPSRAGLSAAAAGETLWMTGRGLRLKTKIYRSASAGDHPVLLLVLHGDSPFGPPSYQYIFARRAASQIDGVVSAALLRPGYADGTGDQSSGARGLTTGDNYTPDVVDAGADILDQLKAKLRPRATVLMGHSGGAAIAANMLGRHPSAAEGALLVSCPCDLAAWRSHMLKLQKNPIWTLPVRSLSPIELSGSVAPTVHVRMLVGSQDDIAPPELTEKYAAALRARGIDVAATIAPDLPHDILLESIAFEQLDALVRTLSEITPVK